MRSQYTPEPWQEQSACRGPDSPPLEAFFPEDGGRGAEKRALEVQTFCHTRCPVIEECAEYARRTKQRYGIWGGVYLANEGMTESRQRKAAAQQMKELAREEAEALQER